MSTPILVTTPGSPTANSYCTVAEADAYHETRLHSSAWPANISASVVIGGITLTVVAPGTAGNSWTAEAVLAAGNSQPMSVALVDTDITVTLGTGIAGAIDPTKNTVALVAAALTSLSGVSVAISGTGSISVTAKTSFTGGSNIEEVKNVALTMATRLLDSMYSWAEWSTTTTQSLQWPRIGVLDFLQLSNIPDYEIPDRLKEATAEFARQLIVSDTTANSDIETQGIKSLSAGPVSLAFKDSITPKVVPDAVINLIPSWWGKPRARKQMTRELVRA